MRNQAQVAVSPQRWSARLVLLSLAGIFFLTLLPFHFNFHATLPNHRSALLLAGWGKEFTGLDALLNILLFVPFGFAVSEAGAEHGGSKARLAFWAFVLGCSLSYGIELLQIFVPGRDSGWGDIATNTTGSLVGFACFRVCGPALVRLLSRGESLLTRLLAWPKFAWILPLYFAFWLVLSIPLQQQTRLNNWDRFPLLLVGNDASDKYGGAWRGEVYSLQLWDRALGAARVEQLTAQGNPLPGRAGLLADYDFSVALPVRDQMNFLPELVPMSKLRAGVFRESANEPGTRFDGHDWLTSGTPVTNLVMALEKTNQFTIRVVCRPKQLGEVRAAIVSLSARSGIADLELAQQDADLTFLFRNSLSPARPLKWVIPEVFTTGRTRDLLFSYDGSTAVFYLDGQPAPIPYRLGPGPALARYFRHTKSGELEGYSGVYYALLFFIGGTLAGLSLRSCEPKNRAGAFWLVFSLSVPALLLEVILVVVSGKAFSWAAVALSVGLLLGGASWINADRHPLRPGHR